MGNFIPFVLLVHVIPDVSSDFLDVERDSGLELSDGVFNEEATLDLFGEVNVPSDDFHVTDSFERFGDAVFN